MYLTSPNHKNHPSTVWTRTQQETLSVALGSHGSLKVKNTLAAMVKCSMTITKCAEALKNPPEAVPDIEWTDPPQCMPDECKRETSLAGYTEYFNYKPKVIDMRWMGVKCA